MRKTSWLEALGPSYIERAFQLAAEADPGAQLVYNDYSLETDPGKAQATLTLLRKWKDKGVPVHAVGLQAHLNTDDQFHPLEHFCKEVNQLGLEILITELDVWEKTFAFDKKDRDKRVADKTKEFLDIVFSVATPKQILTWGLSDRYSWLSSAEANDQNPFGRSTRGLPLDENLRRKPMWDVINDHLRQ